MRASSCLLYTSGLVGQAVLADFKANVGVVGRTTSVPATVIPRQSLIGSNRAVRQLADEGMDADLSSAGMIGVPVVIVLVLAQLSVIRADIALQPGVVGSCGTVSYTHLVLRTITGHQF